MGLFGPEKPNIERMKENKDIAGLNKCLKDTDPNEYVLPNAAWAREKLAEMKGGGGLLIDG